MANDLGFIDPTAGGSKAKISMAPRPMDLVGKVVGLLDNTKEQADVILHTVADALRERYGVAKVIVRRKEFYSRPASDELIDAMAKEVQVAAAALGG
ncbi:MAG: hypothetical protein HY323_02080 [Betaproteobacteria bacterium]|nr:hypothetical protein [Betaproteobacteria bacterium]